ncbi:hypothetical protein [Snuella sedimenti]|uniref:Lipoprotein n=1 Tax=Snuella sedimenti TaxID=2798802 RepID=A0A8J7J676_9FLAO|nr:hypothetical protein [Snuella sedimenti]MBJ6369683.1 hypothetical protein [Snuella sedimenti]
MVKKLLLILVLIYVGSACNNNDETDPNCANIACTEEFRTLTLTIKDSNDMPVALDSFKVVAVISGDDLTRETNSSELALMQQNGTYPLFGDEHANTYQNKELEVQFRGFKDDQQIVSENYVVAADCCHVFLVSGTTEVVLE